MLLSHGEEATFEARLFLPRPPLEGVGEAARAEPGLPVGRGRQPRGHPSPRRLGDALHSVGERARDEVERQRVGGQPPAVVTPQGRSGAPVTPGVMLQSEPLAWLRNVYPLLLIYRPGWLL